MRLHTVAIVAIALVFLLAVVAQAQPDERQPADELTVRAGIASGGGYRLTGQVWQGNVAISGGGYRLHIAPQPKLTGSGCCCTYLPCIMR